MKERNFSENFNNVMTEITKIDKEGNTIFGVCAFKPISENNRIYKEKAIKSLVTMLDNKKCFRNHGGMFSGSGVEDLLGEHKNPRRQNGGIYTDLSLLESARFKDMIFDIAENKPHLAGFSINARGKFAEELDSEGREQVEDIVMLRSCDFVGEPATTGGVWEAKEENDLAKAKKELVEKIVKIEELEKTIEQLEKDKKFFRNAYMKSHSALTDNKKEPKKLSLEEAREITGKKDDDDIW